MRSCDFAIARFQYLRNLMFVHGHYYYRRIATVVFYFFYKVFFIVCNFSVSRVIAPKFLLNLER